MGSRAVVKAAGMGLLYVEATDKGISQISFRRPRGWTASKGSTASERWIRILEKELGRLAGGGLRRFTCAADLGALPPFTRKVLKALARAPRRPLSYKDLARLSGSPRAARAVGGAMARNPVPVLIPCHLVLASDGGLGGFSGGLPMKRRLLGLEGSGA